MLPGGHQHRLSEEVGVPACSPEASTVDGVEEAGARRKWGDPFTADAKELSRSPARPLPTWATLPTLPRPPEDGVSLPATHRPQS